MEIEISDDAAAVVAGLVAPSSEVNHGGIYASGKVIGEIRRAFPVELFRQWAAREGNTYEPANTNQSELSAEALAAIPEIAAFLRSTADGDASSLLPKHVSSGLRVAANVLELELEAGEK